MDGAFEMMAGFKFTNSTVRYDSSNIAFHFIEILKLFHWMKTILLIIHMVDLFSSN